MPLVLEAHPGVEHEAARAAVRSAWAAVRAQAELDGVPVADADEGAVLRRLGLPAPVDDAGVLATALQVVRAAARAYG